MNARVIPPKPILLAGAALAGSALLPWQLAWLSALAAIIVLGVPHGALDGELARSLLRPRFGRLWFLVFSLPYLALFALVLLTWQRFPLPMLAAFLAMSVWHFGAEDTRTGTVTDILFRGGLPIALPVLAHPAATTFVFGTVARVPLHVPPPWLLLAALGWLAVAIFAVGETLATQGWRTLAPCIVLVLVFILLPPLTAFAIYFICVHAPSHTAALIRDPRRAPRVRSGKTAWLLALPLTGLTLLIGVALWPLFTGSLPARLLALTIESLSALTLPHMLLNAWLDHTNSMPLIAAGRRSRAKSHSRAIENAAG